jgi:hypothetical protein
MGDAVQEHGMSAIMSTPSGPPVHNESSPGETPDKETDSEIFKALRKHVEYKQMDMGEMVRSQGLSSALAAMEEAEINPIVQHGEWCGLSITCPWLASSHIVPVTAL